MPGPDSPANPAPAVFQPHTSYNLRMHAKSIAAVIAASTSLFLGACDNPEREMANLVAMSASPTGTGRSLCAKALAADVRAGKLKYSAAIDKAVELLDAVAAKKARSADATAFAGAVLDAGVMIDDMLPKQGEFELFWINLGRLAFRAAEEAHANERVPEAMTLVFAGPERWQTQPYWERYSDHDGLAAMLLAKTGQKGLALERLRSRVELRGVAEEVYKILQKP